LLRNKGFSLHPAIAPKLRNTNGWDVLDGYGCHPEREISETKWNTDDSLLKASSKVHEQVWCKIFNAGSTVQE